MKESEYYHVLITEAMRNLARAREKKSREWFKNQKVSGFNPDLNTNEGWYTGGLGESIFETIFPEAQYVDKKGFDYELWGRKYEVKCSRRAMLKPWPEAFLSLPQGEAERAIGLFVWTWVIGKVKEETEGWLLGWKEPEAFLKEAAKKNKGMINWENRFEYKVDCYEIRIASLHPFDVIEAWLEDEHGKEVPLFSTPVFVKKR